MFRNTNRTCTGTGSRTGSRTGSGTGWVEYENANLCEIRNKNQIITYKINMFRYSNRTCTATGPRSGSRKYDMTFYVRLGVKIK